MSSYHTHKEGSGFGRVGLSKIRSVSLTVALPITLLVLKNPIRMNTFCHFSVYRVLVSKYFGLCLSLPVGLLRKSQ